MRITTGLMKDRVVFVAISEYREKDTLKSAGFWWDRDGKRWYTYDPLVAAQLIDHADDVVKAEIEKAKGTLAESRATDADVEIPVPDGLTYMPFQKAGISYGMNRDAVLIGDEMGLGKTIQAIGIINAMPKPKRVLVICPASLKINWKREMQKWLIHKMPIEIVNGGGLKKTGVNIINYDVLRKYPVDEVEWDVLIVDECHYLKNPKALRTQAVLGTEKRKDVEEKKGITARKRILLTGTPIVNRPVELFPIIHYLNPEEFPKFFPYALRYCNAIQTRYGWDMSGSSNLGELQNRLRRTVMVRRLKKDVLTELPPKVRQIVEIPSNGCTGSIEKEKATWSNMRKRLEDLRFAVEMAKAKSEAAYQDAVSRLREGAQAAFEEFSAVRLETAMAKIPHVVDFLNEILESTDKVVVFAHHHDVVDALKEAFPGNSVVLTGRENQIVRQEAVDRFQSDPTVNVFIGSITAAGVGITLTASSHVVFAELDWVPGNMSQAEDRCHRIGQTDSVFVQHFVLEESIDARMARTLISKQAVIDAAMDADVEIKKIPVLPLPEIEECATAKRSRKEIQEEAVKLTPEQIQAVHTALRIVQGVCDRAQELDGMGFNRFDVRMGHALAWEESLTPQQAAIGRRIVMKYKKQYGQELFDIIKGEKE
ncbi:MAG TPA: DEAD/DEAH box helicase [bacterium]|nr:DEAD/DEAH box helicase [bacterium]